MTSVQARGRFAHARVAHLATVSADGLPHLVPITFALLGSDRVVTAVDHKPKRTTALRRLANIAANPAVAVLVDHYEEEWEQLWWARADGRARVLDPEREAEERAAALEALVARYPQYRERVPAGPVIVIDVSRWSGWSAGGATTG